MKIGLCARDSLFSWKILFDCETGSHELIFSASSATEEKQWKTEIIKCAADLADGAQRGNTFRKDAYFFVSLALEPLPTRPEGGRPLTRIPTTPSFASTRPRSNSKEVCIRNTNYPNSAAEDSPSHADDEQISRARSVYSRRNPIVLTPRRQDRIRLEKFIADVYTRDMLPFPGMALARGDILSRTGSLIRRFSIHTGFSRRSSSLSMTHAHDNSPVEGTNHARDNEGAGNNTLSDLLTNQERKGPSSREHKFQGMAKSPGWMSPRKRVSRTATDPSVLCNAGSDSRQGQGKKRDLLHAVLFRGHRRSSSSKEYDP